MLCPVLGMRARSSDPFLAQCLSKFDVAVEPTRGPQCPALAAEPPPPRQVVVRRWGAAGGGGLDQEPRPRGSYLDLN